MSTENIQHQLAQLRPEFIRLRGDTDSPPHATLIIPVNAQGDLETVLMPLAQIAAYRGPHAIEVMLVINNYPDNQPPSAIADFENSGITVVAAPSVRRSGEVVIITARALGIQHAAAEITIHFDADCRIRNIDRLLAWYIATLSSGNGLAYSHVGYYDLFHKPSIYARIASHHASRFKRVLMGIPTTRGSNYGIRRELFLQLYQSGKLSVDLQVGPAAKLSGATIAYSGKADLTVYTSGRRFSGGWVKLARYLRYRIRYNLKATPTKKRDVTRSSWDGFDRESETRAADFNFNMQPKSTGKPR